MPDLIPPESEENRTIEQELFSKLVCSTIAQSNWYTNNPSESFFVARHDVLLELSTQITEFYRKNCGNKQGIYERDRTYMKFREWILSDELQKFIGPNYKFQEPYVAGSAYTPLRRDDSAVDVFVKVSKTDGTVLKAIPFELVDKFAMAFCQKFAVADKDQVAVTNDVFTIRKEGFALSVRLVYFDAPPFGVRLTVALNYYDDFCNSFSEIAFFLHAFFEHLRVSSSGTEKLVVPNAHCINILLVHFLQYYEQIPNLFMRSDGRLYYSTIGEIYQHNLTAYEPSVLQDYLDFRVQRHDRAPSAGDLLIMFFYHYGYLVDLPHVAIDPICGEIIPKKNNLDGIELMVCDLDSILGRDVPDAFKLQHLCRDVFQEIKNCGNTTMILEHLMAMRLDRSFNTYSDEHFVRRQLQLGANEHLLEDMLKQKPEYCKVAANQTKLRDENGFEVTYCSITTLYTRNFQLKGPGKPEKEKPLPAYSDEMHMLKTYLQRPVPYQNQRAPSTAASISARAANMFKTTVLPNPNNLSQLNIIFRPPQDFSKRLMASNDYFMEPGAAIIKSYPVPAPSYFEMLLTGCHREIKPTEKARRHFFAEKRFKKDVSEEETAKLEEQKRLIEKDVTEEISKMNEFGQHAPIYIAPENPQEEDPAPVSAPTPASKNKRKNKKKKINKPVQGSVTPESPSLDKEMDNLETAAKKMKTCEEIITNTDARQKECTPDVTTEANELSIPVEIPLEATDELSDPRLESQQNMISQDQLPPQQEGVPHAAVQNDVDDLSGINTDGPEVPVELQKCVNNDVADLPFPEPNPQNNKYQNTSTLQYVTSGPYAGRYIANPMARFNQKLDYSNLRATVPSFAVSINCPDYEPDIQAGVVKRLRFHEAVAALKLEYLSWLEPWNRPGVKYHRLSYYD